jgi:hypothetical protein
MTAVSPDRIHQQALAVAADGESAMANGQFKLAADLFEMASSLAFTAAIHVDAAADTPRYRFFKQASADLRDRRFAALDALDRLEHPEDYAGEQ